jgi:hypothetical protein
LRDHQGAWAMSANFTETKIETIVLTPEAQQTKRRAEAYLRDPNQARKLLAAVAGKTKNFKFLE